MCVFESMRPVAVALAWALTCATALAAPPGSARALMERHQTHHFHDGGSAPAAALFDGDATTPTLIVRRGHPAIGMAEALGGGAGAPPGASLFYLAAPPGVPTDVDVTAERLSDDGLASSFKSTSEFCGNPSGVVRVSQAMSRFTPLCMALLQRLLLQRIGA